MHSTNKTVRDATLFDLLVLGKLAQDYAEETNEMSNHSLDPSVLMANLAATIASKDGYLRVLVVNGKIVGSLWGCLTSMPWSSVKFAQDLIVYVDKQYRGYGGLLIGDWVRWAKEMGAKEVCLSTASGIETERTKKLFSRYGFKLVGHAYTMEVT